ncbi:MAG: helix-turn-helix domain-containing protein [Clostridia bacterium]|nr:helix-turn-helix domain-containing protein [Clostridia bacterium]
MIVKIERSIHYAMKEYSGKSVSFEEISPMFIGYQHNPTGGRSEKHLRFFYVVHVIKEGEGAVIVGNERHTLKSGDVFIVKPHVPIVYDYGENNGLKYAWIGFLGSLAKKLDDVPCVCALNGEYYERIKRLVDENEIVYAQPVNEILLDMIGELAQKEEDNLLKTVKEYLDENFDKDIRVESLAKKFSYNRTYLSRVFKRAYGVSPKGYLMNKRLANSLSLIVQGESVSSACYKSGFTNPYNFSKYFKEKYGVSPSNYKTKKDA